MALSISSFNAKHVPSFVYSTKAEPSNIKSCTPKEVRLGRKPRSDTLYSMGGLHQLLEDLQMHNLAAHNDYECSFTAEEDDSEVVSDPNETGSLSSNENSTQSVTITPSLHNEQTSGIEQEKQQQRQNQQQHNQYQHRHHHQTQIQTMQEHVQQHSHHAPHMLHHRVLPHEILRSNSISGDGSVRSNSGPNVMNSTVSSMPAPTLSYANVVRHYPPPQQTSDSAWFTGNPLTGLQNMNKADNSPYLYFAAPRPMYDGSSGYPAISGTNPSINPTVPMQYARQRRSAPSPSSQSQPSMRYSRPSPELSVQHQYARDDASMPSPLPPDFRQPAVYNHSAPNTPSRRIKASSNPTPQDERLEGDEVEDNRRPSKNSNNNQNRRHTQQQHQPPPGYINAPGGLAQPVPRRAVSETNFRQRQAPESFGFVNRSTSMDYLSACAQYRPPGASMVSSGVSSSGSGPANSMSSQRGCLPPPGLGVGLMPESRSNALLGSTHSTSPKRYRNNNNNNNNSTSGYKDGPYSRREGVNNGRDSSRGSQSVGSQSQKK